VTRDAWDRIDNPDRYSATTDSSGSAGAPQAYPGHTSEAGEMPSSESTTGRVSGTDLSSGFSGSRTAGMDDRTGGMMGTDIGDRDVDDFASSYRGRYQGRKFDEVENDLHRDWDSSRSSSGKTWDNVKDSVRRAWHKVERAIPGDADRDGR
jgi:hypothetical protein